MVARVDRRGISFNLEARPELAQEIGAAGQRFSTTTRATLGENLHQAAETSWAVEYVAKILLACRSGGGEPILILEKEIEFITTHWCSLKDTRQGSNPGRWRAFEAKDFLADLQGFK